MAEANLQCVSQNNHDWKRRILYFLSGSERILIGVSHVGTNVSNIYRFVPLYSQLSGLKTEGKISDITALPSSIH
jgi:hypothetical protein